MRLCDKDIEIWLNEGRLIITPYPKKAQINGATIDIHLGNKFSVFNDYMAPFVDLEELEKTKIIEKLTINHEIELIGDDVFYLHPGKLALSTTYESVTLPIDLIGWLDGRSSLARLGLMVHITAHRIDPGWSGHIVLEFLNVGHLPLVLHPGMKIGALSFELLTGPSSRPYNRRQDAKYRN